MSILFAPRSINLLCFVFCTGLILTALYFQYFMGMDPCPLCMAQRIVIYVCGAVFLIAAIHNPVQLGRKIYAGLTFLLSIGGLALATRQLWLQSLPEDEIPACGPGLDYMMEVLPLGELISVMMRGTGDCAEVQWTFLTLSIPGWTFVCFIVMAIASLMLFKNRST